MHPLHKFAVILPVIVSFACDKGPSPSATTQTATPKAVETSAKKAPPPRRTGLNTVVDVALGSKDHTTLVTALGAAEYVDSLDNAGPFTVFAPTNAAFDKLPPGTVAGLLKAEKMDDLRNIIKFHLTVSVYTEKNLVGVQVLAMADGAKATFHVKNGKLSINDANIVGSVQATNGIVHVIDGVLLPPAAQ